MVRPDYKSFEANDLHMSTTSSDEAEGVALQPLSGKDAPKRSNRSRFLTVALGVLTFAGVILLVSSKGGSTSKTMLPTNEVVVDMHAFETTTAGSTGNIAYLFPFRQDLRSQLLLWFMMLITNI